MAVFLRQLLTLLEIQSRILALKYVHYPILTSVSAGLDLTGASNAGCNSNLGQVYARAAESNGRYAILYAVSKTLLLPRLIVNIEFHSGICPKTNRLQGLAIVTTGKA